MEIITKGEGVGEGEDENGSKSDDEMSFARLFLVSVLYLLNSCVDPIFFIRNRF